MQARLLASGRTGWYLRVLEPGEAPADGPVFLEAQDPADVSVFDAHMAMSDNALEDRGRTRAVAEHPALAERWRVPLLRRLQR